MTLQRQANKVIDGVPAGQTIRFRVSAAGSTESVELTRAPCGQNGAPLVGISMLQNFPFKVTISSQDIGGPSAGLMWALGLYDLLTPADLTSGRTIAGTGAIDGSGKVYPIGGVSEKLIAAKRAGASVFFVPRANLGEAQASSSGLRLVPVDNLQDALDFLRSGG